MSFLAKSRLRAALRSGRIRIRSESQPMFDPDEQVSESCIDLRIHGSASRYANAHQIIDLKDLTSANIGDVRNVSAGYFEEFEITDDGYLLGKNETIFTTTHERICLGAGLIGFVVGRANFAKLGIQVTCVAPKCPPGLDWHFPLQITNLSGLSVRIYPHSRMVQLLIATIVGGGGIYRGPQSQFASNSGTRLSESIKPILAGRDTRPNHARWIADITETEKKSLRNPARTKATGKKIRQGKL